MNFTVPRGFQKKPLSGRAHWPLRRFVLIAVFVFPTIAAPMPWTPEFSLNSGLAQDDQTSNLWVTLTPTGARASFKMPTKPRFVEKSLSPLEGQPPIKVRLYMSTVAKGNVSYMFAYHDLHSAPKDAKTMNESLDGAVNGSVANVLGQLIDPKSLDGMKRNPEPISKENHPGRLFIYRFVQNKKEFIVTGQVFIIGKRMYQLNCVMAADLFDQILVAKFLTSFKIVLPESDMPPRPRVAAGN